MIVCVACVVGGDVCSNQCGLEDTVGWCNNWRKVEGVVRRCVDKTRYYPQPDYLLSKPQLNFNLNPIKPEVGFDTKMTVHTYKLWIFTI